MDAPFRVRIVNVRAKPEYVAWFRARIRPPSGEELDWAQEQARKIQQYDFITRRFLEVV